MSEDQNRTVYQGGKIVLTDDLEIDVDTYTLTIKGNVELEGDTDSVTQDDLDALQAQIDALAARVDALENPV